MAYTPMMEQYFKIKEQHPDCIVFFRLGDFYEMFFEDAKTGSKALEIALTARDCGGGQKAPMCGVPFHAVNTYVNKLITKGFKVAICEQLTDPKETKGIVERDVVRIITPGTLMGDELENERKNNYVLCAIKHSGIYYISLCDVSTGEFLYNEFSGRHGFNSMLREITGYAPREIVLEERGFVDENLSLNVNKSYVKPKEYSEYNRIFTTQFGTASQISKGCVTVCAMLISYLLDTQKNNLDHIKNATHIPLNEYMEIDGNAKKHLELFENLTGTKEGSLLSLLDKTDTSMGARLLRSWLNHPLLDVNKINDRQNAVASIMDNLLLCSKLHELLAKVYDIERIISKLAYKTINARDCVSLKKSVAVLPDLKAVVGNIKCKYMSRIYEEMDTMEDVYELLEKAINPEPPISVKEGDIINPDFNDQLKELYNMSVNSSETLLRLEEAEKEETGIKNLKLGYNRIFGYYFEVTKSYYDKVPYRYVRKQTLANCERFITDELKEIEDKITGANDKRIKLEYALFEEIRGVLTDQISRFQKAADIIARLDCINSLADVAGRLSYIRPSMTTSGELKIEKGRHPIVEAAIKDGFVANDTYLNTDDERFAIITGPNMAGKSTYMRQIALITIMAHIGSFVPAKAASVCVTSKIFTRIGALDNLSQGKSTFMVEMSELANIIENADKDSLIILDEIGRGTSTIDGVSIALAAVHYIAAKIGAKTLFATHYHQLSDLEGKIDGVVNYKVAVTEEGDKVAFLHTIKRGGTDKSFGIYVARLAGLPSDFIAMANSIMSSQSTDDFKPEYDAEKIVIPQNDYKEKFEDVKSMLSMVDIDNMTPIKAMQVLYDLKEQVKD